METETSNVDFARFLKKYLAQRFQMDVNDVGVMELDSPTPRPIWQVFLGLDAYAIACQPGKPETWMKSAVWILRKIEESRESTTQ